MLKIDDIKTISYDTTKYDFRGIVQDILEYDDLEKFHTSIEEKVEFADQYNDQDTNHHRKFYSQFEEKLIPTFHKLTGQILNMVMRSMIRTKQG